MKKFFLVLFLICALFLTGCNSENNNNDNLQNDAENQKQDVFNPIDNDTNADENEDKDEQKTSENKIVTLKGGMFSTVTDFNEYANSNDFISAQKNEDGTVSLTMTQARYEKLLNDTIATAEKSFSKTIQKNSAIKQIEHNDDLTEITMLVDSSNYDYKEDTSYYNIYLNTGFYRSLDKPDAKCKIIIKDATTNAEVYEITYPLDK